MIRRLLLPFLLGVAVVGAFAPALDAQGCAALQCTGGTCTQQFPLVPGWNAVFLEVQPEPREVESVFQQLPIESVWTWDPTRLRVDAVESVAESVLRETGFFGYFPPQRADSFLTNLFEVQVHRPYLVRLGGSTPVCFPITGRPSLRRIRWAPDSYNLVGGGVDYDSPGTFGDAFAPSAAHADLVVYRLDPAGSGNWERIANPLVTPRLPGEAVWIYTEGASDWQGPMDVRVPHGDGLSFLEATGLLTLEMRNRSPGPRSFRVELGPEAAERFARRKIDVATAGVVHPILPIPFQTDPVDPGGVTYLDLAPRRGELAGSLAAVLTVTDGAGSRRLVPLEVGAGEVEARGGTASAAGLWAGSLTLDRVSEVHGDPLAAPSCVCGAEQPDGSCEQCSATLDLRLLLHVDASGSVRLLKEVVQMCEPDTADPETCGEPVLLTDMGRTSEFLGLMPRGDTRIGVRMSAAAFDYDAADADALGGILASSGALAPSGNLAFSLNLAADHPTNPYRHRRHPDHDGDCACAERFLPTEPEYQACLDHCSGRETFAVARQIDLVVDASDPREQDCPAGSSPCQTDWQTRRLSGTYAEELSGLHRETIRMSGSFEIFKVSTTERLVGPVATGESL